MAIEGTQWFKQEEEGAMRLMIGGDKAGEVDSGQIMQGLEGHDNNLGILRVVGYY